MRHAGLSGTLDTARPVGQHEPSTNTGHEATQEVKTSLMSSLLLKVQICWPNQKQTKRGTTRSASTRIIVGTTR